MKITQNKVLNILLALILLALVADIIVQKRRINATERQVAVQREVLVKQEQLYGATLTELDTLRQILSEIRHRQPNSNF